MDEKTGLPNLDLMDDMESLQHFTGDSQEVLAKYNHCKFCGSHLHFTHITDFSKNITQETAKCPECQIRVRRVMHKLQ